MKKYLEINGSKFLYDSSSNKYGEPEDFFKFHQLPDSLLRKTTFLSQSLYSYSIDKRSDSLCLTTEGLCSYDEWWWIQNYGLFQHYSEQWTDETYRFQTFWQLISFNDQPVGNPTKVLAQKNIRSTLSGNQLIFANTRNQIRWRGLSGTDHLSIRLYNCNGKLIFSSCQLPRTSILNASQFSSGAYILRYQVNNGLWKHFSFVIN
jgi:hypothetical protein